MEQKNNQTLAEAVDELTANWRDLCREVTKIMEPTVKAIADLVAQLERITKGESKK